MRRLDSAWEPGGQQLDESRFSEIPVIAQEFLDGLDVFWHFSVAPAIAGCPSGKCSDSEMRKAKLDAEFHTPGPCPEGYNKEGW
jgi:hypothetical protein